MRRIGLGCLCIMLALIIWLWGFGGADVVSRWAIATQRDVQNAMASSLRALKAGQPGAVTALWGLCFTYGFVHAAGPGHGKLVIGGYGVGARVAAKRLVGLAVMSSLTQALMAVVLVYVAIWVLGWGRAQMTAAADGVFAPLSYALIASVGGWLALRGVRHFWRTRRVAYDHGDGLCESCGHAHGPTSEQAAHVRSFRDAVVVVLSIAIRPCTGAVFLLILTHALGLQWAGIAGVFIMGAGTAVFTGMVAFAAVGLRESTLAQIAGGSSTARMLAGAEVLAGVTITVLAVQLLLRAI
jgi:nickel/cobalt exporter